MNTPKSEIEALMIAWLRALEAKDSAAMTAAYADECVLFDLMGPPKIGRSAIKAAWDQRWPYLPARLSARHEELRILAGGDLAIAHARHVMRNAETADGAEQSLRVTVVYRRTDAGWRVIHEHVSAQS